MSASVDPVESPCVCATLRMTTRAVARVYDQALEPHGLRTTQYSILARLELEGPAAVGHLAARLAMDRTTLAREAAPLVEAGLVEQEIGEDRRRRVLKLSPEGSARLEAAQPGLARRATGRASEARLRPRPGPAGGAPGAAGRRSDVRAPDATVARQRGQTASFFVVLGALCFCPCTRASRPSGAPGST